MTGRRALLAATLAAAALVSLPASHAGEAREYIRGARAQALGGAFTGLADDEQAIFYNPAGLAGIQKSAFHYGVVDGFVSEDIVSRVLAGQTGLSFSADSVDQFFGEHLYGRAAITPTLVMPNLAIAFVVDHSEGVYTQNKALPHVTVSYETTNGIQVGYGHSFSRGRNSRHDFRVGVGAKFLYRRGGVFELALDELVNLSLAKVQELAGNFQYGIGVDLGAQHVTKFPNGMTVSTGIAFMNVGDVTFGDGQPAMLRGNLSVGTAVSFNLRGSKVTLAYDYRQMLAETDWRKKSHFGVELALPVVSLYGHVNQVSLGYGAAIDIWIARITVLSTGEQIGSFAHQDTERRWQLRAALKFNL